MRKNSDFRPPSRNMRMLGSNILSAEAAFGCGCAEDLDRHAPDDAPGTDVAAARKQKRAALAAVVACVYVCLVRAHCSSSLLFDTGSAVLRSWAKSDTCHSSSIHR
jgi:hypothetical protein